MPRDTSDKNQRENANSRRNSGSMGKREKWPYTCNKITTSQIQIKGDSLLASSKFHFQVPVPSYPSQLKS